VLEAPSHSEPSGNWDSVLATDCCLAREYVSFSHGCHRRHIRRQLSSRQNLVVAGAVRAVADAAMEDTLARAIAVRAGRRPDHERLLFAIVDGLEDHKLTAPAFILRQTEQVLCGGRAVARQRPVPRGTPTSHLDKGVVGWAGW
jgi:hypothetical protein